MSVTPHNPPSVASFDAATQRLEEIISLMDDPDTSLEEMIRLVEEGTKLKRDCVTILQQAELRIQQLELPPTPASSPSSTSHDSQPQQDNDFTLL